MILPGMVAAKRKFYPPVIHKIAEFALFTNLHHSGNWLKVLQQFGADVAKSSVIVANTIMGDVSGNFFRFPTRFSSQAFNV
jgi:hypothetical protein